MLYEGILYSCPSCKVKEQDKKIIKEGNIKYSDNKELNNKKVNN